MFNLFAFTISATSWIPEESESPCGLGPCCTRPRRLYHTNPLVVDVVDHNTNAAADAAAAHNPSASVVAGTTWACRTARVRDHHNNYPDRLLESTWSPLICFKNHE
jgi:hypothetical protein